MTDKHKLIEEAWKGTTAYYSKVNGWTIVITCNGMDDFPKEIQETYDIEYLEQDIMRYRPKSLRVIDDIIEKEESELAKIIYKEEKRSMRRFRIFAIICFVILYFILIHKFNP